VIQKIQDNLISILTEYLSKVIRLNSLIITQLFEEVT